eukprot:3745980-Amphidinium_carterae.1
MVMQCLPFAVVCFLNDLQRGGECNIQQAFVVHSCLQTPQLKTDKAQRRKGLVTSNQDAINQCGDSCIVRKLEHVMS